jgi:hypothetical protein
LDLISATLSKRSALTMAARATAVIAFARKRLRRKFGPNKKSGCVITVTAFDRSRVNQEDADNFSRPLSYEYCHETVAAARYLVNSKIISGKSNAKREWYRANIDAGWRLGNSSSWAPSGHSLWAYPHRRLDGFFGICLIQSHPAAVLDHETCLISEYV